MQEMLVQFQGVAVGAPFSEKAEHKFILKSALGHHLSVASAVWGDVFSFENLVFLLPACFSISFDQKRVA